MKLFEKVTGVRPFFTQCSWRSVDNSVWCLSPL